MTKYQWILFDADGTLFDYDMAEAGALESAFVEERLPFPPATAESYREINRQVWVDFEQGRISAEALRVARFEQLLAELGVAGDAEALSERYLALLAMQAHLEIGAEELLRKLSGRYHLAIITNGLKDVQRPRLARSTIAGYFQVVAISEEIGAAKPDPAYFDAVFDLMGRPPRRQALVVGDSLSSDMQGGINYGLDTCWYNPRRLQTSLPVTYQIHALAELAPLLLAQDQQP